MTRLVALFLLVAISDAFAQVNRSAVSNPDVTVRAFIEPSGEVYVGQLARLWVEVTTSTWFTQAPRYPDLQLPGAIVLMPEQLGVNFTDRQGGETRTGQRQRYVIIPQRPGTLVIPALTVTAGVSVDGKPSPPIAVRTGPLTMSVLMPPGAEELDQIVSTPTLSADQRYDREFEGLKVGDGVRRMVTIRGENTFALALPEVRFVAVDGARVYPAQPQLKDSVNRGQYRAERTDAATYMLERQGEVRLPDIVIKWWDPERKTLEEKVLPGTSFSVAPAPERSVDEPATDMVDGLYQQAVQAAGAFALWLLANIAWLTITAIMIYLCWLFARRFGPPLVTKWRAAIARRDQSEGRTFRRFRRACRTGDARNMTSAFWQWLDRLSPGNQAATVRGLAGGGDDDCRFQLFAASVARGRYGPSPREMFSANQVYRQVAEFRRHLLNRRRRRDTLNDHPDRDVLNPRSAGSTRS